MEEFFEPGTEINPRVSFNPESKVFMFGGTSDCRDPDKFYRMYQQQIVAYLGRKEADGLTIKFKFDFVSSASLNAVDNLLAAISETAEKMRITVDAVWVFGDDPTVEEGATMLKSLEGDWPSVNFATQPM